MADLFPYPENITSMTKLFNHVNTITDNWFGPMILVIVAVIAFISTKSYSSGKAFGFAGFLTFIVAMLLRLLGLISNAILYFAIAFMIISAVGLFFSKEQSQV